MSQPNAQTNSHYLRIVRAYQEFTRWSRQLSQARLRKIVSFVLNILIAAILGLLFYQHRAELPLLAYTLTVPVLAASLLLCLVSFLFLFIIWMDLMGYQRVERMRALEEYVRTVFLGWLPGGLWKIAGRMTIYRAPRLSANTILAINFIETLLLLCANAIILLSISPLDSTLRWMGASILLLGLIGLALRISRFLPAFQPYSLLDAGQMPVPTSQFIVQRLHWFISVMPRWLGWLGGYALAWLSGGIITLLIVQPFYPSITLLDALVVWCLAGGMGVLLQMLPLNMLVRDITMVTLLQSFMPFSRAIIAALALRLVLMSCDLCIGWMFLCWVKFRRHSS